MATLSESLTAHFYAWERRGRGWTVYPSRVRVEPVYRPFRRTALRAQVPDDGRVPPAWEVAWRWLTRRRAPGHDLSEDEGPEAEPVDGDEEPWVEIRVRLPEEVPITADLSEQLLLALASAGGRVAFEFVSVGGDVSLQLAVPEDRAESLERLLRAYVPEATLARTQALRQTWEAVGGEPVIVEFGLRNEFMLPLAERRSMAVDPLLTLVSTLEGVRRGEVALVQVLVAPARADWAVSALRAMSDGEGRAFFIDAPETLSLTREKMSRPLVAAVVRVGACASDEKRSWEMARGVGESLMTLFAGGTNGLIPLENDGYDDAEHEADLLDRATRRTGMLLASSELCQLVHLPTASVRCEGLRSPSRRTRAAPQLLASGEVLLGTNAHKGISAPVWLRQAERLRHMHLIGATGSGKSTLLKHLIRQDLDAGRGVALLDPHGDLADEILGLVPESRIGDVVLFDPADEDHPVGFNALEAHSDREKELLSSDLVGVFRRFSTSWGDQMTAVLGNAVLAFLESREGGSLLDLRRFLMDRDTRASVLVQVEDPLVRSFWGEEFPRLTGRPQMPIITRLDAFLRPKAIRNIVCQRKSGFDLGKLMDADGIFIGRLSQGSIGEQNAYLLGSLLVAKFQQAALARDRQAEGDRRPFYLYLDEFHHFTTPSIASLLSGARKYALGLVLAHQELRQLAENDIRSAVLANAAVRVCFRVGDEDARALAAGFRSFQAADLMSLGVGEAVCRVGQADQDFNLRCAPPEASDQEKEHGRREAIRALSRQRYSTSRAVVEQAIAQTYTQGAGAAEAAPVEVRQVAPPERATPKQHAGEAPTERRQAPATKGLRRPVPEPGKGGPQHKYLQSLIKSYAEGRGFRATIEAPCEGGGSIDVLLEREGFKLACEISVTTQPEHECGNVGKCLAAGVDRVVVVCVSPTGLKRLAAALGAGIAGIDASRVTVLSPAEIIDFLDEQGPPEPEVKTVRGYKVKTSRAGGSGDSARSVAKTIVSALRRMRGK